MVRGAKTIAEFKIRKHLEKLRLIYDQETRTVIEI